MQKKNNNFKVSKILMLLLSFVMILNSFPPLNVQAAETINEQQITYDGGEKSSDWSTVNGVKVSKTIEATGTEDLFDITLQVKSKKSVKEIMQNDSADVVFVVDLSETMNAGINGKDTNTFNDKKVGKSILAIQSFAKQYYEKSKDKYPNNKIAAVGFNTDGQDLVGLTVVNNYRTFSSTLEANIKRIVNKENYDTSVKRFTNIEAGLKKAETLLKTSNSKYKYIIFISDGMPTTYINGDGYIGYDPRELTDRINSNKKLSEYVNPNTNVHYFGSNYSDTGAKRARIKAMNLKKSGVTIYSVGVGLSTFSGWHDDANNYGNAVPYKSDKGKMNGEQLLVNEIARSVLVDWYSVENKFGPVTKGKSGKTTWSNTTAEWNDKKNEILGFEWEIRRNYSGYANYYWNGSGTTPMYDALKETGARSRTLFRSWLRYGIGSGIYYDVNDSNGLQTSIDTIIGSIDKNLQDRRTSLWATTDPLSTRGNPLTEYIEFVGFYNKNNVLQPVTTIELKGTHTSKGENSVKITKSTTYPEGIINWDLKDSGWTTEENGNVYVYKLKYRVRLKVDKQGFVHGKAYETNGPTTLTYANINGDTITDNKTINYPIPSVKGFLESLKIKKTVSGISAKYNNLDSNSKVYTFKVQFQNTNNSFKYNKYSATGVKGPDQTIRSGDTFTLEKDEYIIINNLYHGIKYTVTETAKDGFVTTYTGDTTATTQSDPTKIKEYSVTYNNKLYQLKLKKFDSDTQTPLQGVKFTLYRTYNASNGTFSDPVTNMNEVLLKDMLTDSYGVIDFGNISFTAGGRTTYYLVEEDTIDRYCLLDSYIKVIVDSNGITTEYSGIDANIQTSKLDDNLGNTFEISAPNNIGIELPVTGGYGSIYYTVCGIVLMLIAGIGYKKLMKEQ